MTPRRLAVLVALLVASALAVAAVGPVLLLPSRPPPAAARAVPPAAPADPADPADPERAPAPLADPAPSPDLRDVSPGILTRAAASRALERAAPACVPAARPGAAACAPERQTVEIHWDVRRDP